MRRVVLIGVLIFSACLPASAQADRKAGGARDVERELMRLELEWSAAYLKHDTAAAERILADDFVGIDGRGLMSDKAKELEEIRGPKPGEPAPPFVVLEETITDMKVRPYGDVAVMTGRTVEKIRMNDKESVIQYRRTTVWVKRGGRWQCVSFHGSRILQPPPQ